MHSVLAGVAGGDLFLLKLIPLEKGSQCIRKCQNWCKSWRGFGGPGRGGGVLRMEGYLLQSQRVSVDQWHFLSQIALESIHSDLASTDNIATAFSSFNYNIYIYVHILSMCIAVRTWETAWQAILTHFIF